MIFSILFKQFERTTDTIPTFYFEYTVNPVLKNMVKATVGTLFDVGIGKISIEQFNAILQSQDRSKASGSADAEGLFLWEVQY